MLMSVRYIYYKDLLFQAKTSPKPHLDRGCPERRRVLIPYKRAMASRTKAI